MRIIPKKDIFNLQNSQKLKLNSISFIEKNYNEIYTDEGVYIINDNNISKLKFLDDNIYSISINNKNFFIDNSRIDYNEEFSIPNKYDILNTTEYQYKLYPKFKTIYIEKYVNNKKFDNYFYTKETNIDSIIFGEINEYLKYLN